jgi:hypothetical protein
MITIQGLYFKLTHKSNGNVLDGNTKGDVYTLESNGDNNQRWVFEDLGGGFYCIRQKATGKVLDGNSKGVCYTSSWNGGDYQRWSLVDLGNGYCRIVQKATGRVLDGDAKNKVYTLTWNGGDFQQWKLEFAALSLNPEIVDVKYASDGYPKNVKPTLISQTEVDNTTGNVTITKTISESCAKSCTFEWGVTQTLAVGVDVKAKVKVPFVSIEADLGVNFSLETDQSTSITQTQTYEISDEISVPPSTSVIISGLLDWAENVSYPCTYLVNVKGTADTTSGTRNLTNTELKAVLNSQGFTGTVVDDSNPTMLQVSLAGTFAGCYGLNCYTKLETVVKQNV